MQIDKNSSTSPGTLVSDWIEAFNQHDVARIVVLYASDAVLIDAGMKRARHGRQEIEQWFEKRFRTMPSISYLPISQLFAENQAAVYWTSRGRTPRMLGLSWLSRPFQVDGMSLFTLKEGLIIKQRGFYDHLSVVEQALPPLRWLLPVRL